MFFLVFLRISAIVMTLPVFSSNSIPALFKIGLAISISLILFSILKLDPLPVISHILPFAVGVIGEIMIGVIIGLSVKVIFAGIQLAGQLVGYQMGMALANVIDPSTSEQVPIMAQFIQLFALLILVVTNAHHWFIRALAESYRLVPLFGFHFSHSVMAQVMELGANMFVIAIKVGAPIITALFLTSVAFALIARTVPQMNVLIVAMPLKIGVGLLFLGFSLPYISSFLKTLVNGLGKNIVLLLRAMS
jgi:flagellar biosynthetic protein FliR